MVFRFVSLQCMFLFSFFVWGAHGSVPLLFQELGCLFVRFVAGLRERS